MVDNINSSSFYRGAAQLKDKRVLVVGGGNSACDMYVYTYRATQWLRLA